MSRKYFVIFVFCLMSAMLFSGCGKSDNDDTSDKLKDNIPTTMAGGTDFYNIFLLHKNGQTVLLENHDEYDQSFINTYILARHEITESDAIKGCLEWASENDYDINGEGYTPVYVPTDPSSIRVLTGEGLYAGDWSPTVLNVE